MIQLRRIRTFNPTGKDPQTWEKPTSPPVEYESVAALFADFPQALAKVAPSERYNIYYTMGTNRPRDDGKRDWLGQCVIPFDIDDIIAPDGTFDQKLFLDTVFTVLDVEREKCIVVASGNGLQVLIQIPGTIDDEAFFAKQKKAYERICRDLDAAIGAQGLAGKTDPSSFAHNRIMRFPGTDNRKDDRPTRRAVLLHGNLQEQDFAIKPKAGKPKKEKAAHAEKDPLDVAPKDQITDRQMSRFAIDTPAVEGGCDFLKWAKATPEDLNEPAWYAMLSVVGRLEGGREKAHEYSAGHPSYTARATDVKLDQALAASGPRTCDNIDPLWGKCHTCPNFKQVTSPIMLKSETFVATGDKGFYLLGKGGGLIPQFEDLRRHFDQTQGYKSHEKSGTTYVWQEKKYATWSDTQLRNYAHEAFSPKPAEHVAREFLGWISRTNLIRHEWFRTSTEGCINFANGVLTTDTGGIQPHDRSFGFLYVLPFDYDPAATCPVFDQFMEDVTQGDKQLQKILLEFIGYAICDQRYWLQKALFLIGEGSNGKSTFLKIMAELAGDENVSVLSLTDLQSETSRSQLEGKLLNVSDELPHYCLKNTELLKKLLSGGTTMTRRLYHDSVTHENTTKFIFAGNGLPPADDSSEGLFRRLVIVPFDAKFKLGRGVEGAKDADPALVDKMKKELPGIFNRVFHRYQALVKRGSLAASKKSDAEHDRYRSEVDKIGTWAKENLYWNGSWTDKDPKVTIDAVFSLYATEAKSSEEKPMSKGAFSKQLRRHIDHWDGRYDRVYINREKHSILKGVEFRKDMPQKEHF